MVLRVYAMWNRSKLILGVLLCICILERMTAFVVAGIFFNPNTYLSGMSGSPLIR